jgi:hypothetical protein
MEDIPGIVLKYVGQLDFVAGHATTVFEPLFTAKGSYTPGCG